MNKFLLQIKVTLLILITICVIASNVTADNVTYTYDDAGRLTKADYGNGMKITYTYDKAGNILEIKVAGTPGTAPDISASPGNKDFEEIISGNSSIPQTFTVSNTGTDGLVIGALSLTGTAASEFGIQNDTCSGNTLEQSENCTVEAIFSPATDGTKSANLRILSNDPDTPTLEIPLSGIGSTDTDGDGIADSWELRYFANLTIANGTTDYDNDGLSDKNEYDNKSNPKVKRSDRDILYVDFSYTGTESGTQSQPYNTLVEAINAVGEGGDIIIKNGVTSETFTGLNKISKKVTIKSSGGTATIGQ